MSIPHTYLKCGITFGSVPVGTTAYKSFALKNKHHETTTFYVTRNSQTNPIYYVFDVNKYEAIVPPGEEFALKISYSPKIPGSNDLDYFTISDSQIVYHWSIRGHCIGPSVSCSIRNLTFFQTPKNKITLQVFELENKSEVAAIFQFDFDEEGVFVVQPLQGSLEPGEHKFISVKFKGALGLYTRQLFCLVLYHEPIVINLYGIHCRDSTYDGPELIIKYYPFPLEETVGFKGYFSDRVTMKQVPPPVSLTVNHLDCGRMISESTCQSLTTSLTNHMDSSIEVIWENLKEFEIYPQKLEIPAKRSAFYECTFKPEDGCKLSGGICNALVFWPAANCDESSLSIQMPIAINLRYIGHSFPKNQIWIPSVSFKPSNIIILPLCLPCGSSWTTFMIKSTSHLPVMYKLIPPNNTKFLMKPMLGLIRNYQIVAVQLETNLKEAKAYIEKWCIELNGQLQDCIEIYVKAQTAVPSINVAFNNCIQFESMQPGSEITSYFPVQNVSFCPLQFEFEATEKFWVDPPNGFLSPNEEMFATAFYVADLDENGTSSKNINCRIQYISSDNIPTGASINTPITVITQVIYTELCGFPHSYECGQVEYGTVVKTHFFIFNFGEANVNFRLNHDHYLNDVTLSPAIGRCGPKEKIRIEVEFKIHRLEKNTLSIFYNNRICPCREDVILSEGPKTIFRIEYECIFGTLQITDIVEQNFGPLFSKDDLWKMLNIDDLNTALVETNHCEITRIDLHVPEHEISDKLFYIVFGLKNVSNVPTKLVLRWRQVCFCKQRESQQSFTFRIKVLDCPHKDNFIMETSDSHIAANALQTLSFKFKHFFPLTNMYSYIMDLTHKRTVILNVFIHAIPLNYSTLSVYESSYCLNMGFVYIGLREGPIFAFWVYNNSDKFTFYKVDDLEIVKLCNEDGFPVLKCLNCKGVVKPYSSAPILFKFLPIEVKEYEVLLPLFLGSNQKQLIVKGYGTDKTSKFPFSPIILQHHLRNNCVSLSTDKLLLAPIIASNKTERMFFIKNQSKTQEIKYSWNTCFIDGLVKIEPVKMNGLLQPKESEPVVIKIHSMHEPCSLRILLILEFYDYNEMNKYERFITEHRSGSDMDSLNVNLVAPEIFHIALPIFINVVGISDRDTCIPIEDQFNQRPFEKIKFDVDGFVKEQFGTTKVKERPFRFKKDSLKIENVAIIENKELISNVLENIISDALFSEYFRQSLDLLKTEPSPLYSQIKLKGMNRKKEQEKETKNYFTRPDVSEVGDICEELILDSLHDLFKLGPVNKNQNSLTE